MEECDLYSISVTKQNCKNDATLPVFHWLNEQVVQNWCYNVILKSH